MRGPIPGVAPLLMPVAHALLQAREDLERSVLGVGTEELWRRPGGAAAAGYHLRHLAGSLDRLMTYARDESLTDAQRQALAEEGATGMPASVLLDTARVTIDRALDQLRHTRPETLLDPRAVGRARLPTTVLGLLFHAGEHTARHVGQLITTLKVIRG